MGLISGYFIPMWIGMAVNPHVRTRIDSLMNKEFPGGLNNTVTDETLLISYDYEQQKPFFYSKWFEHKYANSGEAEKTWNINKTASVDSMTVGQSVAASAARPDVFKPMKGLNVNGLSTELIDGGVACSNPTLYAFNMARNLYGYKNIRILSLGSTHEPFVLFKPSAFSEDSKYIKRGAMTSEIMAYTTDYFLSYNDFNT
jgi:hypothetical protein